MGKLLCISALVLLVSLTSCSKHGKKSSGNASVKEKKSMPAHNAPNQSRIDSIKAAKTKKKKEGNN